MIVLDCCHAAQLVPSLQADKQCKAELQGWSASSDVSLEAALGGTSLEIVVSAREGERAWTTEKGRPQFTATLLRVLQGEASSDLRGG